MFCIDVGGSCLDVVRSLTDRRHALLFAELQQVDGVVYTCQHVGKLRERRISVVGACQHVAVVTLRALGVFSPRSRK
jgi:hypothetical protein